MVYITVTVKNGSVNEYLKLKCYYIHCVIVCIVHYYQQQRNAKQNLIETPTNIPIDSNLYLQLALLMSLVQFNV